MGSIAVLDPRRQVSGFLMLVFAITLAGCSGENDVERVVYEGRTDPARVDSLNATDFLTTLFSAPRIPPLSRSGSTGSLATGMGLGTNPMGRLAPDSQMADFVLPSAARVSASSEPAVAQSYRVEDVIRGRIGGALELSGRVDASGVGELRFRWRAFDDGQGFVVDGRAVLEIERSSGPGRIERSRLDIARVEFRGPAWHRALSGSILIESDLPARFERLVTDLDVVDLDRERAHRYEDFEVSTYYDARFSPISQSLEGRLYLDLHGWVYVSTDSPLGCDQCDSDFANTGGPVVVAGAGGSRARLLPGRARKVRVDYDAAGDGTWTKLGVYDWRHIGGPTPPNAAPRIEHLELSPDSPTALTDLTASAHADDEDWDPVTIRYEWRINGVLVDEVLTSTLPTGGHVRGDLVEVTAVASDGLLEARETLAIAIENSPPVADAGPDLGGRFDETVTLDGRASHDVDGDALAYSWTIRSRPDFRAEAELTSSANALASFRTERQGSWTVGLTVSDGIASDWDMMALEVAPWNLFEPPLDIEITTEATTIHAIAVGDVTGDGLADVVLAGGHPESPRARVWVVAQGPSGAFQTPQWFPVPVPDVIEPSWLVPTPRSVDIADLNGDGRLDVVVSVLSDVVVLHQLEEGGLGVPTTHALASEWWPATKRAIATDVDGDGRSDVVAFSGWTETPRVSIQRQLSGGELANPTLHSLNWVPDDLAIGDVDGDGRDDIVFVSAFGAHALLDRGGPELQSEHLFSTSSTSGFPRTGVAMGDLDGTGRDSLVTGRGSSVVARSQTARWQFEERALGPIQGDGDVIAIVDVNQDGRQDVVVVDYEVGVLIQREDGTMWPDQRYDVGYPSGYPEQLWVGDFDADGRPEIFTTRRDGFSVLRARAPAP